MIRRLRRFGGLTGVCPLMATPVRSVSGKRSRAEGAQPYRKSNVEAMARRGTPGNGRRWTRDRTEGRPAPPLANRRQRARAPAAEFLQCFSPRKWPSFRVGYNEAPRPVSPCLQRQTLLLSHRAGPRCGMASDPRRSRAAARKPQVQGAANRRLLKERCIRKRDWRSKAWIHFTRRNHDKEVSLGKLGKQPLLDAELAVAGRRWRITTRLSRARGA